MRDDAIAHGLDAQVVTDRVRTHACLLGQGLPGQVNGVRADLVWFLRAVSDRAHDCQFSLPERHTARAGPPGSPRIGLVAVPLTKNTVNMRMSDAVRRAGDAAHATGRAFRSGGQASSKATRRTAGLVHRITGAQGADRTGLGTLIEMTAVSGAADAFVTVALAGTIFFSTSVDQARGRVVLFLIITMAPFAVLAPFIGPALDRIQQGRRFVLAGTMLTRGLLCYAMSANVANSVTLLPAAFGILVLQKAGGVVKASVTPRLLPADLTLVTANARSGLISMAASTAAAGLAAGVQFGGRRGLDAARRHADLPGRDGPGVPAARADRRAPRRGWHPRPCPCRSVRRRPGRRRRQTRPDMPRPTLPLPPGEPPSANGSPRFRPSGAAKSALVAGAPSPTSVPSSPRR